MIYKRNAIIAVITALLLPTAHIVQAAEPVSLYSSKTRGVHVAQNTTDDNLNTSWIIKGKENFIHYKFNEEVTLEAVRVAFHKGDQRVSKIRIESTNTPWNGSPWQTQPLMRSSGNSLELETFTFATPVTAKFFRIVVMGTIGNKWGYKSLWSGISEVEFIDYVEVPTDQPIVALPLTNFTMSAHNIDGNLTISWTDANAASYRVLFWNEQGQLHEWTTSGNTQVIPAPQSTQAGQYIVEAYDALGNSIFSEPTSTEAL